MNPFYDGGGGKNDTLTTMGDRPSIYTVEAQYNNANHSQRGGSRRRSWLMLFGGRYGKSGKLVVVSFCLTFGVKTCVR